MIRITLHKEHTELQALWEQFKLIRDLGIGISYAIKLTWLLYKGHEVIIQSMNNRAAIAKLLHLFETSAFIAGLCRNMYEIHNPVEFNKNPNYYYFKSIYLNDQYAAGIYVSKRRLY